MIQRITLLFRIVKRIKIWKLHLLPAMPPKEDIMKDAETLSLDMNLVSELVEQEETDDEEDDDDELFAMQRMCSS